MAVNKIGARFDQGMVMGKFYTIAVSSSIQVEML